jgi:arsenite-transporting ATPase
LNSVTFDVWYDPL